jgi:hypothetical protein
MKERQLKGGGSSRAVRVGGTVRRAAGPWTPAVHDLLVYLADNGFEYAPRPLGFDERGREILTYLPGEAAHRPWPEVLLTDAGLEQVAKVLRQYHDVVRGYVPPPREVWRLGRIKWQPGMIIRHGDLGPWNTLWAGGKLTGLVDWDFAEPGEALVDLAQLAWYFVPLRGEQGWRKAGFDQEPDFRHRLEVLAASYGGVSVEALLEAVMKLQQADLVITERLGGGGVHPWNLFYERGGMDIIRAENEWLKQTLS